MAFVRFNNGRPPITMTREKALILQSVINGTAVGSARQKAFAKTVLKIYFGTPPKPAPPPTQLDLLGDSDNISSKG